MIFRKYRRMTEEEMKERSKKIGVPSPTEQITKGEFCLASDWYQNLWLTYDEFEQPERLNETTPKGDAKV